MQLSKAQTLAITGNLDEARPNTLAALVRRGLAERRTERAEGTGPGVGYALTEAGRAVRYELRIAEAAEREKRGAVPAAWAQPGVRISTPVGQGTVTARTYFPERDSYDIAFVPDASGDDERIIAAASPYLLPVCPHCDCVDDGSMPARAPLCGFCTAREDDAAEPRSAAPEHQSAEPAGVTVADAEDYARRLPDLFRVGVRYERYVGEWRRSALLATIHMASVAFPGRFDPDTIDGGWMVRLPTGDVAGTWGDVTVAVRAYVITRHPASVVTTGESYECSMRKVAERVAARAAERAAAEARAAEAQVTVGSRVTYHGSLAEQHGRRLIALPCGWSGECEQCDGADTFGDRRWLLVHGDDTPAIVHVRTTSITPVPGDDWPPKDAVPMNVRGYRLYAAHMRPGGSPQARTLYFHSADGVLGNTWLARAADVADPATIARLDQAPEEQPV